MAVKSNNGFAEGVLPEELMKLLLSLASMWGDLIDFSVVEVVHLSGAMTNEVYQMSWPTHDGNANERRTVLVRIYGDGVDLFFDRDEEIRTFDCLSKLGYGPKLFGQFKGGRVEEFIHARTLSADDLRDPKISALIAAKMREFHGLHMPGSKDVILWNRLRKLVGEAKKLCSPEEAEEFQLHNLAKEINWLESAIWAGQQQQEIGFCHNDLQYGNIMIKAENTSITIIDYEYASYNPVAYDIANHFCEMAANYHTDTPHILDYTKYPGVEERHKFIWHYLKSPGSDSSSVEKLAKDVEKYTLCSHIFWALWGIISAHVNHIDFDYMGYARQRLHQYWLRKPHILA